MSGHLLKLKDNGYSSPAKVFAKLKAKVQQEAESEKELIVNAREQRGDGVKTGFNLKTGGVCRADGPGLYQNPAGFCWNEELKENNRFASHETEAQALTLSPISSPEKTFDYPSCAPLRENFPLNDTLRGFTRRNRAHMESTAVSQPLFGVYRDQIHAVTPEITDSFSRIQPTERSIFNKEAVPLNLRSPIGVYSPIKKRLRKSKLDPSDSKKVFWTTEESNEDSGPPQARRKPAVIGDSTQNNTCRQYQFNVKGFPSDRPEPKFQESGSNGLRRPMVVLERVPIMSPGKLFASMKERERKEHQQEHQQIHTHSRRELFAENDSESPESQSDTSKAALIPASPSPPVSLEDPLVLNSPQISIPRKDKAVFRRSVMPKQRNFSFESVIHLRKWFLRRNHQGLFVDGIHNNKNIHWNSNVITERISSSVLRTVSGRVYVLLGRMDIKLASDFPRCFLKKFVNGFPSDWKTLYEMFLSESKEQAVKKNKETVILAKNESELPSSNQSVRKRRLGSVKTPTSCPSPSCSSLNVSRSGRVIKPPLEYWKGGRVILDAHMNVTIYESYETSSPDFLRDACQKTSKKPVRVFLPHSDGLKRQESDKDEGCSVPVRKVKADRKLDRAATNRDQKSTDSSIEMISSPNQVSGETRSKQQRPGAERRLLLDAGPLKQSEPERSSGQRSKRQWQNASRPLRTSESDTNSPESSSIGDKTSNHPFTRRRGKAERGRKGVAVFSKSEPDHRVSPNPSPEALKKNRKCQKKKSRAARKSDEVREDRKERKCTQSSPPAKPSTRATHPDRKHQWNKGNAAVGDEWTEDEVLKLQEAVSCYPKHIAGYWAKVARMVGTRSAEECHKQHTSQGTTQSPAKSANNRKKGKEKAAKPAEPPVISARVGTLKRKQQVRQFLKDLPREDVDDAFSSAYMQNKRIELPSLCLSEDHDFAMSVMEPQTPISSCFPEAKTPQCLHITPGMMGSPNTNDDDKYVYKLQKRMKKNQFNVCKTSSSLKKYTPTASARQTVRKCGNTENDTFFLLEMLPENDEMFDSAEEEDFYFSDS